MRYKKLLAFILAVGISFLAAGYRWGDSGHAIGLISEKGGKARHPSFLQGDYDRFTQIVTATVLPPYRGDARVSLEGSRSITYEIHSAEPIIDLGLHRKPKFKDNTYRGLAPGDRIALWLLMRPPASETTEASEGAKPVFSGKYTLAFYDTLSNKSLLRVPIIFNGKDAADENCH